MFTRRGTAFLLAPLTILLVLFAALSAMFDFDPKWAIKVESPEGRLEYEQLQQAIAKKAAPLRTELAEKIKQVIELATFAVSIGRSREFVAETE